MASREVEAQRAEFLDARRKAGDAAWSPSRAREALRKWAARKNLSSWLRRVDEVTKPFDDEQTFQAFCREEIGRLLKV
jgi:hypothetical protein